MHKKFAVLGHPIAHSQSPQIHQAFANQFNIKLSYERMLVPLNKLADTLKQFQQSGGTGVNITAPFKIEAAQLVQQKTERAQQANAVNTILFNHDQWSGDNTDGVGLLRDLTQNHGIELAHKTILLIGAGGAAQGVLPALLACRPAKLIIVNRTIKTAEQLVAPFNRFNVCLACDLQHLPEQAFDVIINATSVGSKGESLSLPAYIFNNAFCYDLAYGCSAQAFLNQVKQQGVKNYADGAGMLVEQAAEAFYSWHHVKPETQRVIKLLKSI